MKQELKAMLTLAEMQKIFKREAAYESLQKNLTDLPQCATVEYAIKEKQIREGVQRERQYGS
jgi:hypothetical protein